LDCPELLIMSEAGCQAAIIDTSRLLSHADDLAIK
jgi:hypothetical protein